MGQGNKHSEKTIQRRLLPPLLLLLLLLLTLFWLALQSLNRQQVALQSRQQAERISTLFELIREERRQAMDLAMKSFIRMDPQLVPMMRAEDRKNLEADYASTFALFRQRLQISHFYFHDVNRRTILRMHAPDNFGDRIDRQTLLNAASDWKPTSGIELGINGRLSLRAVHPVGYPDNPHGFLELGADINALLGTLRKRMSDKNRFEYLVTLEKAALDRARWEATSGFRSAPTDWDRYDSTVIADRSGNFPQDTMDELVARFTDTSEPVEISRGRRHWIATPIELDPDASHIKLLAVKDVTAISNTFDRVLWTAFVTAAALCALLVAGFYQSLRRVNSAMERQQRELSATTERLDYGLSVANDGIWDWNLQDDSVVFDERYYTMAGYAPGEFPQTYTEFAERIHPDDRLKVRSGIDSFIRGEEPVFDVQFRFEQASGRYMWIRGRGKIVARDTDGRPLRFIGTHADISALREAQEASTRAATLVDKRNRLLESVNRLGHDLAVANSLQEIGRLTVAELRMQDGAPLVGLFLLDEDDPDMLCLEYYDSVRIDSVLFNSAARIPVKGSLNGAALEHGEIQHCSDFRTDERINENVKEVFLGVGAQAETILPLIYRGQWIGTIAIVYLESIDYTEEDRWAHNAVAQTVSIAINNLKNSQEIRRRQFIAESINELSLELNRAPSIEGLTQRTMETLQRRLPGTRAAFYLLQPGTSQLKIIACYGLGDDRLAGAEPLPAQDNWTVDALASQAVTVSRFASATQELDPAIAVQLERDWTGQLVCLPLIHGADALGCVVVLYDESIEFDESQLMAFESMAQTVALALHGAQTTSSLRHQASHDSLTNLPNRFALHDDLDSLLAGSSGPHELAMLLLDLNRFKEVNDTLGHHIGDHLLRALGIRVAPLARVYGGTLYRLGGDEFAVVAETRDAPHIADNIAAALKHPFSINNMNLELDCSIGGAVYPEHGTDSHELLRCADIAMYAAKRANETFKLYDLKLDDKNPQRLEMLSALRSAIDHDQLQLVYQPRVEIATGRVVSCEALLRWQHPSLGAVPPTEFIPLAEMTDVIHSLTPWVIDTALRQLRSWREQGLSTAVSVNISGRNLLDVEFPNRVEQLLQNHAIAASQLEFEITETALVTDPDRALLILRSLAGLGISIAIDDFGTGYSSLNYLKRLPLHALKVDRTFIRDMLEHERDAAIVQSTIGLAHSLGLRVVAEGAENAETSQRLLELGCEEVQGYYYSRPLQPERYIEWSRSYSGSSDGGEAAPP